MDTRANFFIGDHSQTTTPMATPETILGQIDKLYAILGFTPEEQSNPVLIPNDYLMRNIQMTDLLIQPEAASILRHYEDDTLADVNGPKATISTTSLHNSPVSSQTAVAALVASETPGDGLVTISAHRVEQPLPSIHPYDILDVPLKSVYSPSAHVYFSSDTRFSHSGEFIINPENPASSFADEPYFDAPKPSDVSEWTGELLDVGINGLDGLLDLSLPASGKELSPEQVVPYTTTADRTKAHHHAVRSLNLQSGKDSAKVGVFVGRVLRVDDSAFLQIADTFLPKATAAFDSKITYTPRRKGPEREFADYTPEYVGIDATFAGASLGITSDSTLQNNVLVHSLAEELKSGQPVQVRQILGSYYLDDPLNANIKSSSVTLMAIVPAADEGIQKAGPDADKVILTGGLDLLANPEFENEDSDALFRLIGTSESRTSSVITITSIPPTLSHNDADPDALTLQDLPTSWTHSHHSSRGLTLVTTTPDEDFEGDGFMTFDGDPGNVQWHMNIDVLQKAPLFNGRSLRDYNVDYWMKVHSTIGKTEFRRGVYEDATLARSPNSYYPGDMIPKDNTMLTEVEAIIAGLDTSSTPGIVRLLNLRPEQVSAAEDTILYPGPGTDPDDNNDSAAEWESLSGGECIVTGAMCNTRPNPVLMVATVKAISKSVYHKYTHTTNGVVTRSDIGAKEGGSKLDGPIISNIYPDSRQNGVVPRQTEDGSFSVELTISAIIDDSPQFMVTAIEREATNQFSIHVDSSGTEHRASNYLDRHSSIRDVKFVYEVRNPNGTVDGTVEGGYGMGIEQLLYVDVSITIAGLNGFARFAPNAVRDHENMDLQQVNDAWRTAWMEAADSNEYFQVDILNSSFSNNVVVNFYDSPGNVWLRDKPDLSLLNKIGSTTTGVAWTRLIDGHPDDTSGPALITEPAPYPGVDCSEPVIGLAFVRSATRTSLLPGTEAYAMFGNSDEFTFDLEYITELPDAMDFSKQATKYYSRGRQAKLLRSDNTARAGVIVLQGLTTRIELLRHMVTAESITAQYMTHHHITVDRYSSDGGNEMTASTTLLWDGGLISPFLDGLELTMRSDEYLLPLEQQGRRTTSQEHAVSGYGGTIKGAGQVAVTMDGKSIAFYTAHHVRGYHEEVGLITAYRDAYVVTHPGGYFEDQHGFVNGWDPADVDVVIATHPGGYGKVALTPGGYAQFTYTHYPASSTNQFSVPYRYVLSSLSIDGGESIELDGSHKNPGSQLTLSEDWGTIFNDVTFISPLMAGSMTIKLVGDSINGYQLSDLRSPTNGVFEPSYAFDVQALQNFLPSMNVNGAFFRLKLYPPELRLFSNHFRRNDEHLVDERVSINGSSAFYASTHLAAFIDVSWVNPYDLQMGNVTNKSIKPSRLEFLYKYGDTTYVSLPMERAVQNGQYSPPMLINPNYGPSLRVDPHVVVNVTTRALPWPIVLPIDGGKYIVATYTKSESGYDLAQRTPSFDMSGPVVGQLMRFNSDEAGSPDMNIALRFHIGFFSEADLYEGFAWEVQSYNTPFKIEPVKFFEHDEFGRRIGLADRSNS
jgi:hypothetical protein